ncbi:cbb3-type cytochrome c oxidase subunit I [Winogradskyella helgolandensis]|uniref:cbb3-type cytochrome c oxidase subunit I n=1 Tax=Winogradskyella helgolandensis TaxID=2697010 RepID=UPI0015CCCA7C|nr:cbb3-type cytochrome c oxidase subunit I [Winogradskyella helgolandensis]
MNLLTKRPHIIFLVFAVITFILGFNANGGIDINIHDTYYVISNYHFATLISIIFGIIGLIYWIVKKVNGNLSKRLNLVHVTLTFGGIFLILILNEFFRKSIMEYDFNENLTMVIYLISAIVIFGQIIFPINIISGIIRKQNKT